MTIINANEHHPEMTAAVYFGSDREFLVLPLAKDREGWRSEVNRPVGFVWDGVSVSVLGGAVLGCLAVSAASVGHLRDAVPPFLSASGAKSYRGFAKTHQMVNVTCQEDGDCLEVQFWPRDANLMFVGPPAGRSDLTVVLPLGASAGQVGCAVVQVFQAGGVDMGGGVGGVVTGGDGSVGYAGFSELVCFWCRWFVVWTYWFSSGCCVE